MRYIVFVLVSITMQSLTYGYIHSKYSYSENLQFTFMAFMLCSVFYTIRTRLKKMRVEGNDIKHLLLLNIYTAVAFVSFFISITLIPASISGLTEAAAGPLWVLPFSVLILRKKVRLNEIFIGIFLLFVALFVSFSTIAKIDIKEMLGLFLAITAGGGAALIAIYSRKMGAAGGKTAIVLAHRFHLTYIVAFSLVLYQGTWNFEFSYLLVSGLLSFIGIVLPLYLLQLSMEKLDPLQIMLSLAVIPPITYAFEWYFGGGFNLLSFFLICSSVGLSIIYMIFGSKRGLMNK